jgi:uncharacterized lipoprotein YbaY
MLSINTRTSIAFSLSLLGKMSGTGTLAYSDKMALPSSSICIVSLREKSVLLM